MKSEDIQVIEGCLDDATDGIESARKHLRTAMDRANRARDIKLWETLNQFHEKLGIASDSLGSIAIPSPK
jgi:hypothetical protein